MLGFLFKKKTGASWLRFVLAFFGSGIIASGWSWYHLSRHNLVWFYSMVAGLWVAMFAVWKVVQYAFRLLAQSTRRHPFWSTDFWATTDELYGIVSLFFVIFFSRDELVSLVYTGVVIALLFWRLYRVLSKHPEPREWLALTRAFFILGYFLFIVQAGLQYTAYHYYILDSNIRFFNIVLFRTLAMTALWLVGYVVAVYLYQLISVKFIRSLPLVIWVVLFALFIGLWTVNVGILYYSGLYFSPAALEHAEGAGDVVKNALTGYLIFGALIIFIGFVVLFLKSFRLHVGVTQRRWRLYGGVVGLVSLLLLLGLASFRNTPEHAMAVAFYEYYRGTEEKFTLDPVIQKKLEKFGLRYHPNDFYVVEQPTVYSPMSTLKLLPDRFAKTKPNILIVYLESFSARLTDVYNPSFTDLTPNLDAFSKDPHTTVFRHYYNASTPTITGTLSQLCSFLPPTGHNEIQNERKLQNHHLLCLPEVLKKEAGFKYAAYVTAVDKEFAHKDGIFTSMGVDKIYGTSELAKVIPGEPLSWGYSDHQMFPAVMDMMQAAPQPFLMMLATVDTHPPFNLSKDAVNYRDGSQPVLNMFHTTDDAFGKFWQTFKQSPLYNNTIVITVADHAIFPGALTTDITTWPGEKDTASARTYYDQNTFMMYVPDSVLPKDVSVYASGLDEMPTILQMFGINIPNSFEGHSIFDDQALYPNLLGMHELGLYINQVNTKGKRTVDYNVPTEISCDPSYSPSSTPELTLCDYLSFYHWKRQMFEEGRFWKH